MNHRSLPSLKALRAFEAAGRLGSFTAAADELGVTAGAISRQIKTLEDHFQVSLFERNQNEVTLTAESRSYLSLITEVFRELEACTAQLSIKQDRPLNLLCSLTFANRWLVPRLPDFVQRHAGQRVQLTLSKLRNVPGSANDVDIAIQHGTSIAPSFDSLLLARTTLLPVCSPALLSAGETLDAATLVSRYPLLTSGMFDANWELWLQAAGLPELHPSQRLELAVDALTYQAAAQGLGVAMADYALVADELASGVLVCPVKLPVVTGDGWHIVYRSDVADDPRIQQFRDWLLQQAQNVEYPHD